jgi:hypothetical protein
MSQICNFFSRNFVTFQGLKMYNSVVRGMSECGRGTVTNSVVIPEVDIANTYFNNTKHDFRSLLCG